MDKIEYEKRIVDHMISLYCRKNHRSPFSLCPECNLLKDYAFDRLTHCPFKEHKTACKVCALHCCQKDKQSQIRKVMKHSGPRMILYYPFDFIRHFSIK